MLGAGSRIAGAEGRSSRSDADSLGAGVRIEDYFTGFSFHHTVVVSLFFAGFLSSGPTGPITYPGDWAKGCEPHRSQRQSVGKWRPPARRTREPHPHPGDSGPGLPIRPSARLPPPTPLPALSLPLLPPHHPRQPLSGCTPPCVTRTVRLKECAAAGALLPLFSLCFLPPCSCFLTIALSRSLGTPLPGL